jgi:N-acetylneuraminate synthase
MYPTPYDKVRLGAIEDLKREFPDLPVGLSDHSMGIWTCLGAVALGACVLEKHFTISRGWPGPDTSISIEPEELHELIDGANAVWEARGGSKTILEEEKPVIDFAYASICTIAPVKAGETFSRDNIWVKRPGTGPLHATCFDDVLGKTATHDLPVDVQVTPDDIAGFAA